MSKRYLRELVEGGHVSGWDDPRMPTISGMRRRGFPPAAIRDFIGRAGVAKADSVVDYKLLEHCVREDLNINANRAMVVLDPVKVVITNYPEDKKETRPSMNHPMFEEKGERELPISREIYIERMDYMENANRKYHRLKPEGEVRLKDGYIIKHEETIKDADGEIVEIHCTYDPESYSGGPTSGRKIKGTIHWVDANDNVPTEVRLFNSLILDEADGDNFIEKLNPESLTVMENAVAEKSLADIKEGDTFQFMRQGYFCVDRDSTKDKLVFNQVVALRDSFSKTLEK
jgi:glutaminyl-tRNA synthetase